MDLSEEINTLLKEYPQTLWPKTVYEMGQQKTGGNNILAQFEKKLPCNAFLSKSWLLSCRLKHKNLTPEENNFINQAIEYFDLHSEAYQQVKCNPTVKNILTHKLANCGELADSAIKEFQKKGLSVLRANIQLTFPTQKLVEKGILYQSENLPQKTVLQHVFLIYSDREGDSLKTMMEQLDSPYVHVFDLWKRKVGNAGKMMREYLADLNVHSGQLCVQTVGEQKLSAVYSLLANGKIIPPKTRKETHYK